MADTDAAKCSVEGCVRIEGKGLDGTSGPLCLGHFYWQILLPAREAHERARQAYIEVMARTPKQAYDAALAATRPRSRSDDSF